jgi:hypothetical protein
MELDDHELEEGVSAEDQVRGQELLRDIDFGLRVNEFLNGPIGQRLDRDSEAQRTSLMEALVECDVEDSAGRAEARAIRMKIAAIDHWKHLFAAYIEAGKKAEVEYETGG